MSANKQPRVSILIPNYNNGRQSSRTGQCDLIGDLLESLRTTLKDDPTPFEILAFDDGSTDDSVATLRRWAAENTWADARPFLTLMEAPHCGILSITANKLSRAARGDILARLDGDTFCLTPNWVSKLCNLFDQGPPSLGVVGPKQLRPDYHIHAFGDWVLHPKGYHHVAQGMPRDSIRHALEVDHVMGAFYCCKKTVFDQLGGYDEDFLRGQTVDFGLRARLAGWSCFAVPSIEYIHRHGERVLRSTAADSGDGVDDSLETFRCKWGFNRLAPNLDEVRRRYRATPLLWNARWSAPPEPPLRRQYNKPIQIEQTDWMAYTQDDSVRAAVDLRVGIVLDIVRQTGPRRLVVQLGSDIGLIGHLLALQGVNYLGFDEDPARVDFARAVTNRQDYSGSAPRFETLDENNKTSLGPGACDVVLIFDEMEQHPNPVVLLEEARRILEPDGLVAIASKRKGPTEDGPTDRQHCYTFNEMATQLITVGGFGLKIDPKKDDRSRDIVIVGERYGTEWQEPDPIPDDLRRQISVDRAKSPQPQPQQQVACLP